MALTLACRHGQLYKAEHFANPCPAAGNSTDPPIVCIDPISRGVSQDPVRLSSGQIPNRKIAHFFITGGQGDLTINCPGAPVDYFHPAPDHVVLRVQPGGTGKHYPYTVSINGKKYDPDMQIEP